LTVLTDAEQETPILGLSSQMLQLSRIICISVAIGFQHGEEHRETYDNWKIGKNSQLRVSLPLAQFSKITVLSSGQTFDAAT